MNMTRHNTHPAFVIQSDSDLFINIIVMIGMHCVSWAISTKTFVIVKLIDHHLPTLEILKVGSALSKYILLVL